MKPVRRELLTHVSSDFYHDEIFNVTLFDSSNLVVDLLSLLNFSCPRYKYDYDRTVAIDLIIRFKLREMDNNETSKA